MRLPPPRAPPDDRSRLATPWSAACQPTSARFRSEVEWIVRQVAKSCVWTVTAEHGLAASMQADTHDLIIQLLTQSGAIAEDVAAVAVCAADTDISDLATLLEHVEQQLSRSRTLVAAALALFDAQLPGLTHSPPRPG